MLKVLQVIFTPLFVYTVLVVHNLHVLFDAFIMSVHEFHFKSRQLLFMKYRIIANEELYVTGGRS